MDDARHIEVDGDAGAEDGAKVIHLTAGGQIHALVKRGPRIHDTPVVHHSAIYPDINGRRLGDAGAAHGSEVGHVTVIDPDFGGGHVAQIGAGQNHEVIGRPGVSAEYGGSRVHPGADHVV